MSLRRFMHPRNKYKQEPNFKQLAILYPEFRKIAITDLAGKVRINFQNLESLRVLAKTLLKHDFNLNVQIPAEKLVPAIPSRLNYVLWVEDLVKHDKSFTEMSSIRGIDIGTGAVCVYPLLFAKLYSCKMLGTEVDPNSFDSAVKNVNSNDLGHLIEVIRVNKDTILRGSIPENNVYTFTMCNPPFFGTDESETPKSKLPGTRLPPRNAPSGSKVELAVEGGETHFVSKMLDDSMELKDKIKIYTTMLGKKSSLIFLRKELRKRNIENTTWTELCQGRTTRWALAWTFLSKDVIDLNTAPVIRTSVCNKELKQKVKRPPSEIAVPVRDGMTETKELVAILKGMMHELMIRVEELYVKRADSNCWGCQLMADGDAWSHGRRKRRMMENKHSPSKKLCLETPSENVSEKEIRETDITAKVGDVQGSFLVCSLVVGETEADDDKRLKISMAFESGSGGRNALETLRQYLINKLNLRDFLKEQSSSSNNPKSKRVRKKKRSTL